MALTAGPGDRVRYRFSPLERRGVIAGWRGGQIASVAAGLVVGVLALRSRPSRGRRAVAVASVAGPAWPWPSGPSGAAPASSGCPWWCAGAVAPRAAAAASWLRGPACRPRGHASIADGPGPSPSVSGPDPSPARRRASGRRTTASTGCRSSGCPFGAEPAAGGRDSGMIVDGPARTATAVLAVRGHSFALLGPRDQDSRIAAWARVLSSMAREGSDVHRLQWIETCLPDDGGAVRRHCAEHAVLGAESPAGAVVPDAGGRVGAGDPTPPGAAGPVHPHRPGRPGAIRVLGRGRGGHGAVLGPGGPVAAPGPRGRRHHRRRGPRARRPGPGDRGGIALRRSTPHGRSAPARRGTVRRRAGPRQPRPTGRRAGRGPWPSSRSGTRSAPTAPGTPPTGSPSGPGST